jgi:hypothetical protein
MEIEEDKKLILAIWSFLKKYGFLRVSYAAISAFLYSGATNQTFRILDNFWDGGAFVFGFLMIVPYLASRWAFPFDFNNKQCRIALFLCLCSVTLTAFLLAKLFSQILGWSF